MRALRSLACAGCIVGALAGPASAATIRLADVPAGKQLQYLARPGAVDDVGIIYGLTGWQIQDFVEPLTSVPPCSPVNAEDLGGGMTRNTVTCPLAGVVSGLMDLGDGNDLGGLDFYTVMSFEVHAGAGNDTVATLNGFPDTIDCGPGYDTASADWVDTVAADCEQVHRAGDIAPGDLWKRADGKSIGVSINHGAAFTNDAAVTIAAYGPDAATAVTFSNDGGFDMATPTPVAGTSYPWLLEDTGAERLPKTVYARFSGPGVDATRSFTDDIILDQTAPVVKSARVKGGKLLVSARDITSGVAAMQLRYAAGKPGPYRPFAAKLRVRGRAPRFVRVRDRAGNVSSWRGISRRAG